MEYTDPVAKLLTLGEPAFFRKPDQWESYLGKFGFTQEHVQELIRLACDKALHQAGINSLEVWGPMHAWRVLGLLRAPEAIEGLLNVIDLDLDDDWVWEEIPVIYRLLGPPAIPVLARYIDQNRQSYATASTAISGLEQIVKHYPEARDAGVQEAIQLLSSYTENDPAVNGWLIVLLHDCDAQQALPLIEKAFAANSVDEMIMGDWEDVQVEFGVKEPDPNRVRKPTPLQMKFLEMFSTHALPSKKVGRNDPCWCGSSRKYKHCHWKSDQSGT